MWWPTNAECCVARQLRERIGMGGEDGGCVAGYMHAMLMRNLRERRRIGVGKGLNKNR